MAAIDKPTFPDLVLVGQVPTFIFGFRHFCDSTHACQTPSISIFAYHVLPFLSLWICLFPILTIDLENLHIVNRARVQAPNIYVYAARVRSWIIERLDAAMFAEGVCCRARVEPILRECLVTFDKGEVLHRHDQTQVARLRANTAIALSHVDLLWRPDLVPNLSAMTASVMSNHVQPLNLITLRSYKLHRDCFRSKPAGSLQLHIVTGDCSPSSRKTGTSRLSRSHRRVAARLRACA